MNRVLRGIAAVVFTFGFVANAAAECFMQDQPTPGTCYRDESGKCSLGTTIFADTVTCTLPDGSEGAHFTPSVNVRRIGQGWATWASPPFVEDSTPFVGFDMGSSLVIQFNQDAFVAGTEIEPNAFGMFSITATFRDASGGTITTVTRSVEGSSGARLFGVTCTQAEVRSILITADPGAQGFAIAQVRSSAFPAAADSARQDDGEDIPYVPEDATNNADF